MTAAASNTHCVSTLGLQCGKTQQNGLISSSSSAFTFFFHLFDLP